jgi:HAE1 family hydrophobic/amphiphilic exporter-1
VPVQQNNIMSQKIEQYIIQHPLVSTVFSNIAGPGTGMGSLGVGSPNKTEFTIQLKSASERNNVPTEQFMKELRDDLYQKYPGINYSIAAMGLLPKSAPIEITLSGNNVAAVKASGKELKLVLEKIPGIDNVRLSVEEGNPEYKIIPDKDKMQRLGLTSAYVGSNLRTALAGNDDASLTESGTEYPIRIWLDDFNRMNYEDVQSLTIINPMGNAVEVSQFAAVVQDNSPSLLERKDRKPSITLTAYALGRPSGTVAGEVVAYVTKNPLPDDILMTWGSDKKTQDESFGAMGAALLISFILIYLVMVALYDSFLYPFVVLFSIPVATIGAFLALNLSLSNISLFALLGLIMLMGLVAKNAILIVDFTNQLKDQGLQLTEALITAGKERMRPILMTTLAMVFGMLPIALAKGTASEWKNGLAWVIIGGLLSSLILTVYLVPVVYYVMERMKERISQRIFSKKGVTAS